MRSLPAPGTHPAFKNGSMIVYEAPTKSLCVAIPVAIDGEVKWNGKHVITIVKSNGELMTRRIDELKTIFGWDGINPFDLEGIDPENQMPFELVIEHKDWKPDDAPEEQVPSTIVEIVFMNPVGGSANMPASLEEKDRKALLAKFAGKFKAHSSGKPAPAPKALAAAATAQPKPAATPAKPAQGGPPSRGKSNATSATARTSTSEEVWEALTKARPEVTADDLGPIFYAAQDELFPGKNGDLDPKQWGAVADNLGV